jgi:hypothetical protein
MVHPEYRPYSSGQIAIAEWIWKGAIKTLANQLPYMGAFLVLLPDTRARITHAEWLDTQITVACEYTVIPSAIQVQGVVDEKSTAVTVLEPK